MEPDVKYTLNIHFVVSDIIILSFYFYFIHRKRARFNYYGKRLRNKWHRKNIMSKICNGVILKGKNVTQKILEIFWTKKSRLQDFLTSNFVLCKRKRHMEKNDYLIFTH